MTLPDTMLWCVKALPAILERVEQAGVPGFTRLKRDLEAEPSVGIDRLAGRARDSYGHAAVKIPIRIRRVKPLPRLGPLRCDLPTADNLPRLDLENIGKVTPQRDLELKPHRFHAVVGDVEIFVNTAADRSAEGQAEYARRNHTLLGEDGFVGQEDARGVIVDST